MDHTTDTHPPLVDIRGTLHQIPVGRTSLYKLVGDRELEAVKVLGRTFITQRSIDAFIDRRLTADAPQPREDSEEAGEEASGAEQEAAAP